MGLWDTIVHGFFCQGLWMHFCSHFHHLSKVFIMGTFHVIPQLIFVWQLFSAQMALILIECVIVVIIIIKLLGWFFNFIGKLKSKCIHIESRAQFISIRTSYSRFLCLTRIFSEPSGSTGSKHLVIPSCTHRGDSLVLFSGHLQNHSRHIHNFCSQSISSPTPGQDRFLSFHMPATHVDS